MQSNWWSKQRTAHIFLVQRQELLPSFIQRNWKTWSRHFTFTQVWSFINTQTWIFTITWTWFFYNHSHLKFYNYSDLQFYNHADLKFYNYSDLTYYIHLDWKFYLSLGIKEFYNHSNLKFYNHLELKFLQSLTWNFTITWSWNDKKKHVEFWCLPALWRKDILPVPLCTNKMYLLCWWVAHFFTHCLLVTWTSKNH